MLALEDRPITGRRLVEAREKMELSMADAALKLQMGRSRLNSYEVGRIKPPVSVLQELATFYNVSVNYLIGISSNSGNNIGSDEFVGSNFENLDIETFEDSWYCTPDYIERRGLDVHHIVTLNAPDDNMSPTIKKGDEVVIDRLECTVIQEGIYAIAMNETLWFRHIRPDIDGTFHVVAGENSKIFEKNLNKSSLKKLKIIGKAIRISRDI